MLITFFMRHRSVSKMYVLDLWAVGLGRISAQNLRSWLQTETHQYGTLADALGVSSCRARSPKMTLTLIILHFLDALFHLNVTPSL